MKPPQCDGGLSGLQKREYLANHKTMKEIRKGLYLIFIQQVFEAWKTGVFEAGVEMSGCPKSWDQTNEESKGR